MLARAKRSLGEKKCTGELVITRTAQDWNPTLQPGRGVTLEQASPSPHSLWAACRSWLYPRPQGKTAPAREAAPCQVGIAFPGAFQQKGKWRREDVALSQHSPQPPQLCRVIVSLIP